MTEQSEIGRLKSALIRELTDQVENGSAVRDEDSGELRRVSTPANVLAVAAKVVKDHASEVAVDPSITKLEEITRNYQLRKSLPGSGTGTIRADA